jgi:CRP/FNR family transcriptional regulator
LTAAPSVCDQCPVADRAACSTLSEGDRAELARIGRRVHFERGDTIFAAGDDNHICGTLVSGAAKLSAIDEGGTERVVALVHPAGLLGQLFAPSQTHHLTALTATEACLFPRATFEKLVGERPELARRLLGDALRELEESRALIGLISRRQADARVAALLLGFARAASPAPCHDAISFELPLNRGEIAQLLGLTIETVSRNLVALEKQGLIRRQGIHGIEIHDRDALEAMAA